MRRLTAFPVGLLLGALVCGGLALLFDDRREIAGSYFGESVAAPVAWYQDPRLYLGAAVAFGLSAALGTVKRP